MCVCVSIVTLSCYYGTPTTTTTTTLRDNSNPNLLQLGIKKNCRIVVGVNQEEEGSTTTSYFLLLTSYYCYMSCVYCSVSLSVVFVSLTLLF